MGEDSASYPSSVPSPIRRREEEERFRHRYDELGWPGDFSTISDVTNPTDSSHNGSWSPMEMTPNFGSEARMVRSSSDRSIRRNYGPASQLESHRRLASP